jgi:hypothetical protein
MRSSPANASDSCVPIRAIWTSGAVISPTKKTYMTRSPTVIAPACTARPPMIMIVTPSAPTITVETAPTALVPVMVLEMLRKRRSTPPVKISSSRGSAT